MEFIMYIYESSRVIAGCRLECWQNVRHLHIQLKESTFGLKPEIMPSTNELRYININEYNK